MTHESPPFDTWSSLIADRALPAVLVDLDAFDANARYLAGLVRAGGRGNTGREKKIRLATKSFRVAALLRRALDSDPIYQGLMCFSAEEVGFLAERGFDDFLLAYPTLRRPSLEVLAKAALTKQVRVVVDSAEGVDALESAASAAGSTIGYVVEVDVAGRYRGLPPIGVRRSPIRDAAGVTGLVRHAEAAAPHLAFAGVMAYEAQVAGVPDRNPFKNPLLNQAAARLRRQQMKSVAERREELITELDRAGLTAELVNGGGSGSAGWAATESCLTEVAAGSALLAPHLFTSYSNLEVRPALFSALEIVRSSEDGWVTCTGGGYVASGEPGEDRLMVPVHPAGAQLSGLEGCGEVQTPLKVPGSRPALGTPAFFRPAKAGEIAERFNEYLLVSTSQPHGAQVTATPTYRGEGGAFL